ncbi:hypothetical protein VNO78_23665 [Psophocarpus tetragonolobus]|uniref:Protein BREAKING OF ASYMMETRY IN THE STOMATAL LINEAGE n=1 Tax=Psophocarpus tetragonolobus TaxID=3891 RepID=A0AAN9S418_PSOTE
MTTMAWVARSCFSVCCLPLDNHQLTSPPDRTMKNKAFDNKNEKSYTNMCNINLSGSSNKCNSKRQLNNPVIKDKDAGIPIIGNKFDHSSWSLSTDEDYIVFCFGKDVAQDDKGGALGKCLNLNSRPVNRELKYGEGEEQGSELNNTREKRPNANQHHNDQEVQSHQPDLSLQEIERSAESSNSDQSKGSRSSFAFPVLGWEWIGSPVQMPKSEGLHLRKHKARALRFQCCRF